MSLLSRLFGSAPKASAESDATPETYKGYRIFPEPMPADGKFRLAARIEKGEGDETKTHQLIRADLLDDHDSAAAAALRKAQQVIDEQGDRLFTT